MGYSYTHSGALCCDGCSAAGSAAGVRKRKCPLGWCPPPAYCKACNARTGASRKSFHAACAEPARKYAERCAREAGMLARGAALRCSALNVDLSGIHLGPMVHVLFRRGDGSTIGRYMDSATYDSIPLGGPATPECYAAIGRVFDAPGEFDRGGTTKEIRP